VKLFASACRLTGRLVKTFVEMKDEASEDAAIAELDGAEWLNRELRVNKAKPREPRNGSRAM